MHGDREGGVVPIAPEPSANNRSVAAAAESERGSGLDGRQIFFLFVGSAVFACLVFAIGVFVGRRLERGAAAQAAQQSASDPLAILDEIANAEESLTFHRALSNGSPSPRPVRPAAAAGQGADSGARPVLIGPPAPR